jgi:hypothetical protein
MFGAINSSSTARIAVFSLVCRLAMSYNKKALASSATFETVKPPMVAHVLK